MLVCECICIVVGPIYAVMIALCVPVKPPINDAHVAMTQCYFPAIRYLAQYALGFSSKDADGNPAGHAMGTMCSYAGLNGVPSCANDYLLNQVIRSKVRPVMWSQVQQYCLVAYMSVHASLKSICLLDVDN